MEYEKNNMWEEPVKAPQDAKPLREYFYIMRNKKVAGAPQPDGSGIHFIHENKERLQSAAQIVGGLTQEDKEWKLLETADGLRRLVHSIGIRIESKNPKTNVKVAFQMFGAVGHAQDTSTFYTDVKGDGMEAILILDQQNWSPYDAYLGQIRFHFEQAGEEAAVSVRFFLNDGFCAPKQEEEEEVDINSVTYRKMIKKSLMQSGNPARIQRMFEKIEKKEEVNIAFLGGSITQGAWAIPINTECYAYQTFLGICDMANVREKNHIHYCKAGVGGTPSELGMLRYEREILKDGNRVPDLVVVEFAVNDAGDETNGVCYDSLVRKIWNGPGEPAVILLFSVFANDWNLQDRLAVVGEKYDLPMVSIKDAVIEQFYEKKEERTVKKSQFFYDCYHPTNIGHKIMADSLLYAIRLAKDQKKEPDPGTLHLIKAPIGDDFEQVQLLDRLEEIEDRQEVYEKKGIKIDCGSFFEKDIQLQCVEKDLDLVSTPEFPYNWQHKVGSGNKPFILELECRSLILINKDSGEERVGRAEVFDNGKKVLMVDPHENGWVHCNPLICFRNNPGHHHIEIRMMPGEEEKEFTILGFGYVR